MEVEDWINLHEERAKDNKHTPNSHRIGWWIFG
jgi:hypothetical protein